MSNMIVKLITGSVAEVLSILCQGEFACNSMVIAIDSVYEMQINLECDGSFSCYGLLMEINNIHDTNYTQIVANFSCYTAKACNNLQLTTNDAEYIFMTINMYEYSEYVHIDHNYYENIDINCGYDKDKRYIKLLTGRVMTETELLSLSQEEYASNDLPCEGISIDCTGNNTDLPQHCQYTYQLHDRIGLHSIWVRHIPVGPIAFESILMTCLNLVVLEHVINGGYYQYNIMVNMTIFISFSDESSGNVSMESYRACQEHFRTTNATTHSLSIIDNKFTTILEWKEELYQIKRITKHLKQN